MLLQIQGSGELIEILNRHIPRFRLRQNASEARDIRMDLSLEIRDNLENLLTIGQKVKKMSELSIDKITLQGITLFEKSESNVIILEYSIQERHDLLRENALDKNDDGPVGKFAIYYKMAGGEI